MKSIHQFAALDHWFQISTVEPERRVSNLDDLVLTRHGRPPRTLAVRLDFFAICEVAARCNYIQVSADDKGWDPLRAELRELDARSVRLRYSATDRIELADQLLRRLEGDTMGVWHDVPVSLVMSFFELVSEPNVRDHFTDWSRRLTALTIRSCSILLPRLTD